MMDERELAAKAYADLSESVVLKYLATQPRDANGRWTSGGGAFGGFSAGSLGESVKPSEKDMRAPDRATGGQPYSAAHLDANGNFTPERQALHKQIIEDHLAGIRPRGGQPIQYMNGGGPGSGKSSIRKSREAAYPTTREADEFTGKLDLSQPAQAVLIDPDAIKMMLPETRAARAAGDTTWAGKSHEESSYLAKRIHQASVDRGVDLVFDGTGDSGLSGVTKKINVARSKGYRVEGNYIALDAAEGIRRATTRGERTGRFVSHKVIKETYGDVPLTFHEAANAGVFDKLRLFDNNNGAKIIFDDRPTDPAAYQKFLDSGHRD